MLKLSSVIMDANALMLGLFTRMFMLIITKDRTDNSLKGLPSSLLSGGFLHLNFCHYEMLAVVLEVVSTLVLMTNLR